MKKGIYLGFIFSIAVGLTDSVVAQSNITEFTPSALLKKGQFEINAFHSIYTQDELRDREGNRQSLGQRQTFLNGMYQFTTGVSDAGKVNIGLDVNVTRALYDLDGGSPFKVFGAADGRNYARTAVTSIGPRVKFNPFNSIPRLSLQSTFLFPVASDLETPQFLNHDRYTWFTQLFFDKSFGDKFQLFTEASFLYRINRNSTNSTNFFRLPLSVFFSYFPNQNLSFFGFAQYSPRFEEVSNGFDEQFGLSQRFTQLGIGTKIQLTERFGLEFSYGSFVNSRLDGAGNTINFAFRYLKR